MKTLKTKDDATVTLGWQDSTIEYCENENAVF